MLQAMVVAPVGDSVMGEDESELALEKKIAELCGKEAALFVCTGTMSNQIALRVHVHSTPTMYGDILFPSVGHAGFREMGGCVYHARAVPVPVSFDGKYPTALDYERYVNKNHDYHCTTTIGISIENTLAGQITPLEEVKRIRDLAKKNGLFLHMDGARLWNASAETGVPIREWAACVDTLSMCFSKGLGAPIGSVLVGSKQFIAQAREVRKSMGGGWRQCGILAAAASYAIDTNFARLTEDHQNAKYLASELRRLGFDVVEPDTNVVVLTSKTPETNFDVLVPKLKEKGIFISIEQQITNCHSFASPQAVV
jgi:threonine aldolase